MPSDGSTLNQSPNISKSPLGGPVADKPMHCLRRDYIVLERVTGLNRDSRFMFQWWLCQLIYLGPSDNIINFPESPFPIVNDNYKVAFRVKYSTSSLQELGHSAWHTRREQGQFSLTNDETRIPGKGDCFANGNTGELKCRTGKLRLEQVSINWRLHDKLCQETAGLPRGQESLDSSFA